MKCCIYSILYTPSLLSHKYLNLLVHFLSSFSLPNFITVSITNWNSILKGQQRGFFGLISPFLLGRKVLYLQRFFAFGTILNPRVGFRL